MAGYGPFAAPELITKLLLHAGPWQDFKQGTQSLLNQVSAKIREHPKIYLWTTGQGPSLLDKSRRIKGRHASALRRRTKPLNSRERKGLDSRDLHLNVIQREGSVRELTQCLGYNCESPPGPRHHRRSKREAVAQCCSLAKQTTQLTVRPRQTCPVNCHRYISSIIARSWTSFRVRHIFHPRGA